MVDSIPVGACPQKWAKAQAIKARQVAVFAQARERNAAMAEVASITVTLHKGGLVSMKSECCGQPDALYAPFAQDLLGQRAQELAQELRDSLLYGVSF